LSTAAAARSISTVAVVATVDKFGGMYEFTYNKESDRMVYEIYAFIHYMMSCKKRYTHSF
jgi:hypothetical protein